MFAINFYLSVNLLVKECDRLGEAHALVTLGYGAALLCLYLQQICFKV
ncbi:MAG: hypothetical protein ACYT04_15100 [Nostoc sp.]